MSMTIYGGITKNGVNVDDMIDNNNDIVYFHQENKDYFARLSECNVEDVKKPCVVIFNNDEPFVPIYAKVLDCSFKKYEDDKFVSKVVEECWKEAKEFSWEQSKKELLQYAEENGIDLCIESSPLTFELLVDKYEEFKETYKDYQKEEIMKYTIEEWEMEQEADLV